MDFLKEWIRQLALIVLLATCMELLVPMGSMKKYVRMTMGMLTVLTMVSPIAALMGRPLSFDPDLLLGSGDRNLPALNQIMATATEFREKNRALARQEAAAWFAAEARRATLAVAGVAEAEAEVQVGEREGVEQIAGVTLTLRLGDGGRAMRPVAPVRIGPADGSGASDGSGAMSGPAEPQEAGQRVIGAVRREVAARLGIPADPARIRVRIQADPESRRR